MLIVFEGPDGSGKSTLTKNVADALRLPPERHFNFPSMHSAPGRLVREVFEKRVEVDRQAMIFLIMADTLCRMPYLREAVRTGITVSDRYNLISGWVYQTGEGWSIEQIYSIVRPNLLVQPDLTFIVDVPVSVAMTRIEARTAAGGPAKNHLYETDLEAKRNKYLAYSLMKPFGEVVVLDGTRSPEDLTIEALEVIEQKGVTKNDRAFAHLALKRQSGEL
jgi:thymidylate kinase